MHAEILHLDFWFSITPPLSPAIRTQLWFISTAPTGLLVFALSPYTLLFAEYPQGDFYSERQTSAQHPSAAPISGKNMPKSSIRSSVICIPPSKWFSSSNSHRSLPDSAHTPQAADGRQPPRSIPEAAASGPLCLRVPLPPAFSRVATCHTLPLPSVSAQTLPDHGGLPRTSQLTT